MDIVRMKVKDADGMSVCFAHSNMHNIWIKEKDGDEMGVCFGHSDMHRV